jgi:hypothetical protein
MRVVQALASPAVIVVGEVVREAGVVPLSEMASSSLRIAL